VLSLEQIVACAARVTRTDTAAPVTGTTERNASHKLVFSSSE